MQATSGQMTAPAVQALLQDGTLAGEWVLDPGKSRIRLKTKVMGLIPVHGAFREVTGKGTVSPHGAVSGSVVVVAASIDTKNSRRDTHLRSPDFFDSASKPYITFTADGIRLTDEGVAVNGSLTVRDRTRPLSLDAAPSVHGNGEIWLDADVHINRADFEITWNPMGVVSMNNTLAIHLVFTRR